MTSSEGPFRALAVGPAAALELGPSEGLRVHSVFPGAVNLTTEEGLATLTGPAGAGHPHAVAILRPGDFRAWDLVVDGTARIQDGILHLPALAGEVRVELAGAAYPAAPRLAGIPHLAGAYQACLTRLARHQAAAGCALTVGNPCPSILGRELRERILEVLDALSASGHPGHSPVLSSPSIPVHPRSSPAKNAMDVAKALEPACPATSVAFFAGDERGWTGMDGDESTGCIPARLSRAVAALAGLGPGLTPAGDDVLCGLLAAAGPDLGPALGAAMAASLGRTGPISARLMRGAIRGFWPAPLARLAAALAADAEPEALAALRDLLRLGHSSGADLATGYLLGVSAGVHGAHGRSELWI